MDRLERDAQRQRSLNDNIYARTSTTTRPAVGHGFGLTSGGRRLPSPGAGQTLTIVGLEVRLSDTSGSRPVHELPRKVDLSWNSGTTWGTAIASPDPDDASPVRARDLPPPAGDRYLGSGGAHSWTRNDFSDANFRVRLTAFKGCATAGTVSLDTLEVRASTSIDTDHRPRSRPRRARRRPEPPGPGHACANGVANCYKADGAVAQPARLLGAR